MNTILIALAVVCSIGAAAGLGLAFASSRLEPPAGTELSEQEIGKPPDKIALVRCIGNFDNAADKMKYAGISSCDAATQLFGGSGACSYGCLGFGDCVSVCGYGAISVCNGVAAINPEMCRGCSKCAGICPRGIIEFFSIKDISVVRCMNTDKGSETKNVCKAGCTGCMRCVKACLQGAVRAENSLAVIDPVKCTGCGNCNIVCPSKCISSLKVTPLMKI